MTFGVMTELALLSSSFELAGAAKADPTRVDASNVRAVLASIVGVL